MPDTNEMKELEFAMIDEAFLTAWHEHNLKPASAKLYIFLAKNCNFYLKGRVKPLSKEKMQEGARIKKTAMYLGLKELKAAGLLKENEYGLFMPLQMEVYQKSKDMQRKKKDEIDARNEDRYNPRKKEKKDNRKPIELDGSTKKLSAQMNREEFMKAVNERNKSV